MNKHLLFATLFFFTLANKATNEGAHVLEMLTSHTSDALNGLVDPFNKCSSAFANFTIKTIESNNLLGYRGFGESGKRIAQLIITPTIPWSTTMHGTSANKH